MSDLDMSVNCPQPKFLTRSVGSTPPINIKKTTKTNNTWELG